MASSPTRCRNVDVVAICDRDVGKKWWYVACAADDEGLGEAPPT
jgi:hypothetical protein